MASAFRLSSYKKWMTVIGSFLCISGLGIQLYWGNWRVYVQSFVVDHDKEMPSNNQAPWTMSFMELGCCLGLVLSSLLSRKIGKRLTLVFALAIVEAGFVSAYVTVGQSLLGIDFSLGFIAGLGGYIIYGMALKYVLEWSDGQDGMLTSIVQTAYPVGAIVMNQVISRFINPNDLETNQEYANSYLFSQKEVLDRIPDSFIVVAAIILALTMLGILLVRENKKDGEQIMEISSLAPQRANIIDDLESKQEAVLPDISPRQAIRQHILYCGWFFSVNWHTTYIIFGTYYKTYGLTQIDDDRFITNVSGPLLFVLALFRPLVGITLDKLGLKTTYVIISSTCSLTSLMFYFSLYVHPWCYAVMTVIFGVAGNMMYVLSAFYSIKMFGKTHFLGNYALLLLPTVLSAFLLCPLFQYFIVKCGWFYLYMFGSVINVVALTIVIVKIPNV